MGAKHDHNPAAAIQTLRQEKGDEYDQNLSGNSQLEREEGITDEKVYAKRQKRIEEMERKVKESGHRPNPMVVKCVRITQRSLQFIRWVRNALDTRSPWPRAVESLRPLMANYLA